MDDSNTAPGDVYRFNYKKRNPRDTRLSDEDASHDLWDSLESDTESLLQEKAYQRELQKRILNNSSSYDSPLNNETEEHEDVSDTQPDITETRGASYDNLSRQMPLWDEYADLRYDPDWRKKMARSEFLQSNISLDSNEVPGDALRHTGQTSPRGRHDFLVVRSPASSNTDAIHPKPLLSSFHLHLTEKQDTVLSEPQSSWASLESMPRSISNNTMKPEHKINHQRSVAGISPFSPPRQRQQAESQSQHDGENHSSAQEQNIDKLNVATMQRKCSHKVSLNGPREDIVERNKATLGMNSHKQGSYLKAYEQRGGKPDDAYQPVQSAEDTASVDSPGSPDSALNPELIWIQKTQKLKTHNQSKHLDRARPHQHRTKSRGHLNHLVKKLHLQTPSKKQTLSPPDSGSISHCSYSSAPTVNLNINFNTQAKLAEPLISAESPKQLYTLTLPPSSLHLLHDRFKGPSYTVSLPPAGTVDHESIRVTNKSIRISPTQPLFQEGFGANAPQLVVHYGKESMDSAHTLQTYSGAYPVLPPIGGSNNIDTELCSGRPEEATNIIRRTSSKGYLAQLEKQKQMQAKTTYKAYTLKEYKSLNRDMKLGGLGPCNIIAEDMAEKIRQQKLYSNVIREQNKKISRIPCVATGNPVGSDSKNNIPRNKALEYAKTIVKPKAPQQLKERPKDKTESVTGFENSSYIQLGVDLTQLSTLEMLRRRHEQEKQVVARFTSIHNSSSAPSISSL